MERPTLGLRATPEERPAVLWSFAYFFALLASYYVMRPLRDEVAMQLGGHVLQELFSSTFVTMLLVVPVFGWLGRKVPRRRLLPWLYAFFTVSLLGFFVVMRADGTQHPIVARAFYVWVSVFNLFVVSVFWSFMADLFDTEQAKRLYGFIAAGGTAGALAGPSLTAGLVKTVGPRALLLVSAALLASTILAILRLSAWARGREPHARQEPLRGSIVSGLVDLFRSSYLAAISFFLLAYTLLSTFLYFQQADIVPAAIPRSVERVQLLAKVDLAVNVLALVCQLALASRLLTRFGVRAALAVMPAISVVGFAAFAAFPLLPVLVVVGVLRRAGEYAISKPARETLWNALPPEQKYKAKNAIDTLVHRTGDAASAWAFTGLRALGLSGPAISWLSVPIAAAWLAVAFWLGGRAERRDQARPL